MSQIAEYNTPPEKQSGVRGLLSLVTNQITMEGFLVTQPELGPAYAREHQERMQKWMADGSFRPKLHVTKGIDQAVEGFVGMLQGKNFGKAVLTI